MSQLIGVPELLSILEAELEELPDERKQGNNTRYTVKDAFLSAFSVFFTQSGSFLEHQRLMRTQKGRDNAQSLFGIESIPCDNQIRNLLDPVPARTVFGVFRAVYQRLEQTGALKPYHWLHGELLIALDGTEYFTSKKIHCPHCCHRQHKDGSTTYFHAVVTPVVVAPDLEQVISLEPELIRPQDGQNKQDCENAAAKRWIERWRLQEGEPPVTLLGDDLYCNHPICELAVSNGYNFIFVCKPESHKCLYEWVDYLEKTGDMQTLKISRWDGRRRLDYHYRYLNGLPLRSAQPTMWVNWCDLRVTDSRDGTVVYHNAFATCHNIHLQNVEAIVRAGRARWKVENEGNNILKTKGYNLEHNFGHGKNHLAELLLCLNLLAFLFHSALDLVNTTYQQVRHMLVTRRAFFNDIRALTRYLWFESWQRLFEFMLSEGSEPDFVDSG